MANVTGVSFAGETNVENVTETWTMTFTGDSQLNPLDSILITFPAGFDLTGITTGNSYTPPGMNANVTFGPEFISASPDIFIYQVDVVGQLLTIYFYDYNQTGGPALPAATEGTFTVSGIGNPSAGTYVAADFKIVTNKDAGGGVPAADVIITAAASESSITRIPSIASIPSLPSVGGY